MKSNKYFLIGFYLLIIISCGVNQENSANSKTELKRKIKELEDSIATIQKDPNGLAKISSLTNIELINRLTAYYRAFPKDEYSSDCLFKIHMKFSELNAHEKSAAYGDTLLKLFPDYKNKEFLIESMASAYDAYILPRDTVKVKFYFSLLLKDPKVDEDKKRDIRKRLAHLELSFDDYILKMNNLTQ
jgi:hypothetical protein